VVPREDAAANLNAPFMIPSIVLNEAGRDLLWGLATDSRKDYKLWPGSGGNGCSPPQYWRERDVGSIALHPVNREKNVHGAGKVGLRIRLQGFR